MNRPTGLRKPGLPRAKSEIRSIKSETILSTKSKVYSVSDIGPLDLKLVSDFGFRASDFPTGIGPSRIRTGDGGFAIRK
jgi:hypothetical protein